MKEEKVSFIINGYQDRQDAIRAFANSGYFVRVESKPKNSYSWETDYIVMVYGQKNKEEVEDETY